MNENDEERYFEEVVREELEQELKPHKRTGYAEYMYEQADLKRKEQRENSY